MGKNLRVSCSVTGGTKVVEHFFLVSLCVYHKFCLFFESDYGWLTLFRLLHLYTFFFPGERRMGAWCLR